MSVPRYVRDEGAASRGADLGAWLDGSHGARWISLRPARARAVTDAEIDLADLAGVRLLVQGDAELALERGLHGVELRPRGRAVDAARRLLGPERVVALDLRGDASGSDDDLAAADVVLLAPGGGIPGPLPLVAVYATVPLFHDIDSS